MAVEFIDNSVKCKNMINGSCVAWLYEACGELEAQVKRNSKRVTGGTAGSFGYRVDEAALNGYVGSNIQSNGNGRNGTSAYGHNGLVFLNPDKLGTVKAEGTIQVGGSGTTSSYAYWNYSATKNGAASATTLKTISATYTSKTSTYVTSSISIPNLNTADWTEYDPAFGLGTNAYGSGNSSGPSWTGNVKYDVSKKTV
ncbi:MAG: hypothetical protein HFI99_15445 [Lachnospiraceae bacterium]|jgi:hypothetical protein|nr:hypothetical protein [Lachnospiraceae bacterium]